MAKLRFEIEGAPSFVAFPTYVTATSKLLQLLRELDKVISGHYPGTLQWYVAHLQSESHLTIDVVSRVKLTRARQVFSDYGSQVAGSLVTGLDNVQNKGISPPHLSEYGLKHMGEMIDVLNRNGASGYRATVMDSGKTVDVSPVAADTIRQLLPIRRSSIGSVSGKLEAISIHRGGRFVVYQAVNDKAISCKFEESALDRVKALLGRRVVVSGIVHSNIKAEPIRVDVDEIFDLDAELRPDTRELRGAYPGIADGLSPESYIRRLRGE
jgi:hypothetical protein